MAAIACFAVLQILGFVWQSSLILARASITGHYRHPTFDKLADEEVDANDGLRNAKIAVSAGGALHRGHPVMRRESESVGSEEPYGESHHGSHVSKASYNTVDLDGEAEPDYGIVGEHKRRRMHHRDGFFPAVLSERSETYEPEELKVSCGGHRAPDCAQCPTYDNGATVPSRGVDFCHHDCRWCSSGGNAGMCVDLKGVCVSDNVANDHPQTPNLVKKTPDVYDPNITEKDRGVIDEAAEAAIREENVESAEKQKKEEEEAEAKKFSWSKFWLIVIITFSVILGICAIVSVVAIVVFFCMGVTDNAPKELVDEADGEEDGEAEDEAQAS